MIPLLLVGLGLILGSFVNALVWRLREHKDWVRGRSECTHCHHPLAAKDLVPVASWLWLRGKCRYCGKPIADSPLVEAILPLLFVLSYYCWPQLLQGEGLFTFVFWLVFLVGFMALAVYDLKWFLLPNVIVFPLIGLAIAQQLGVAIFYDMTWSDIVGSIAGAVTISGLFYALFHVSRGKWIGFGDVKLGIVLGILAGGVLPAILLLFVASVLGMFIALPQVLAGKANRKSQLPFGPFLLVAMVIVQLWGSGIIDWYRQLLQV